MKNTKTISVTIRKKTLDKLTLLKSIKHNYRITKQSSVVPEKEGQFYIRGITKEGKEVWAQNKKYDREKLLAHFAAKYDDMERLAKGIINDPNNFDNPHGNTGKMKRWARLKHNLASEAVIHFGSGYDLKDGKALAIINRNFTQWVKDMGMAGQVCEPVLHNDEKGQAHLHFIFFATNPTTGRRVEYKKPIAILEDLQTRIAKDMEQFGLRRGDSWRDNPSKRKRHEEPHEYRKRMDDEDAQDAILADIKKKQRNAQSELESIENEIAAKQDELANIAANPIESLERLANEYRFEISKDKYEDEFLEKLTTRTWGTFVKTLPASLIPFLNYLAFNSEITHNAIRQNQTLGYSKPRANPSRGM